MNEILIFLALVVFSAAGLAGATFLAFVIVQAMNDLHLKKTDRGPVQQQRKWAFFSDAIFVLLSVGFQRYWLWEPTVLSVTPVLVGYLAGGIWILSVSSVSMKERAPRSGSEGDRRLPSTLKWLYSRITRRSY